MPVVHEIRKELRETPSSINHIVDDIKNIAQDRPPTLEFTENPIEREHPWGSQQERDIIGSFVKGLNPEDPVRQIMALAPSMDPSRPQELRYFVGPPTNTSNPEPGSLETNEECTIEETQLRNKQYNEFTGITTCPPKPPVVKRPRTACGPSPEANCGTSQWRKRPFKSPKRPTLPSPTKKPADPTSPPPETSDERTANRQYPTNRGTAMAPRTGNKKMRDQRRPNIPRTNVLAHRYGNHPHR